MGAQIQGRTNSASPPSTISGPSGWKRAPAAARSPWKAKDAQWWVAFQAITGANTRAASTAAT